MADAYRGEDTLRSQRPHTIWDQPAYREKARPLRERASLNFPLARVAKAQT